MVPRGHYVGSTATEVALSRSVATSVPLILLALASAACEGGARSASADAPTPTVQERLEDWGTLPEGTSVPIALGFAGPLPDSVVAGLLERHNLRPYSVYLKTADLVATHDRERSRASLEVLAEAREQIVQQMRTSLCAQQGRARAMIEQAGTAGTAGPLDEFREVLSRFLLMQETLPRLELGEPMIYGVAAVGTLPDVQATQSDPTVISYQPGWRTAVESMDTVIVPAPAAPSGGPAGIDPVVAAMPEAQLMARLRDLAETGMGSCEEASGSVGEKP